MKGSIGWELIQSYLEDRCTEEEKRTIADWVALDQKNKKQLALLKRIWDTPADRLPKPDVEKALKNVGERAGIPLDQMDFSSHRIFRFERTDVKSFLKKSGWNFANQRKMNMWTGLLAPIIS